MICHFAICLIMTAYKIRSWTLGYDYLFVNQWQTWEGARQACLQRGLYLARIESEEEANFIWDLVVYGTPGMY